MRVLREILTRLRLRRRRRRAQRTWTGTATVDLEYGPDRTPIRGGITYTQTEATRDDEE